MTVEEVLELSRQWTKVAPWYDLEPYKAALYLEWGVLGRCPFSIGDPECERRNNPTCTMFTHRDGWHLSARCGPLFVHKYNIKPKSPISGEEGE